MSAKRRDQISAGLLVLLGIATHWFARGITARFPNGVDSGFFPEMTSALLVFVAVVIAVSAGRVRQDKKAPSKRDRDLMRVGGTFALMAAFIALMPILGFALSAALFLPAQISVLAPPGHRRLSSFIAVSLVAAGAIYAIFAMGFGLVLPRGPF